MHLSLIHIYFRASQKRILPKMKSPYIRATLFILKRQNPLSSPIFSFKAFQDFLQGLGLLSISSLLSLDIPLFSRISPWFYTKEKDLIERFFRLSLIHISLESRKKPAENKQTAKAVCYLSRYSYSTVYCHSTTVIYKRDCEKKSVNKILL